MNVPCGRCDGRRSPPTCSALSLVTASRFERCLRHCAISPLSWAEMAGSNVPVPEEIASLALLLLLSVPSPALAAASCAAWEAPKLKPGTAGATGAAPENLWGCTGHACSGCEAAGARALRVHTCSCAAAWPHSHPLLPCAHPPKPPEVPALLARNSAAFAELLAL